MLKGPASLNRMMLWLVPHRQTRSCYRPAITLERSGVSNLLPGRNLEDLAHCLSNPGVQQIAIEARVPHHGISDAGKLFRRFQQGEIECSQCRFCDSCRHRQHQIRCLKDSDCGLEIGKMNSYEPPQSSFSKGAVNQILLVRLCLYRDMTEAEVLLHGDRSFAALELPACHANEAVFEERLKAKRRRRGKRTQDELCRQVVFMSSLVPWNDLKRDAGRKTSNDLRQRWQNDTAGIVCHGETKVPLALCRRERFSCPEACHTGQNLPQFAQKGGAPRSQLVVASHSHEQFIAQLGAQAVERSAHGGLAQMNPLRSSRYIALMQQGLERNQKVQVDISELHRTHTFHSNNAWCDYMVSILQSGKEKCPCKTNPSLWSPELIKE
jgi:hypothetical protein